MKRLSRTTAFDIINYIFLAVVCLVILYPFLYLAKISFSSMDSYNIPSLSIIPDSFDLGPMEESFVMSMSYWGLKIQLSEHCSEHH